MGNYNHLFENLSFQEKEELLTELKYVVEVEKRRIEEEKYEELRNSIRLGDFIRVKGGYGNKGKIFECQVINMGMETMTCVGKDGAKHKIKYHMVILG